MTLPDVARRRPGRRGRAARHRRRPPRAGHPHARRRAVAHRRVLRGRHDQGLLLYGLDAGAVFDPTDLAEDVTPAAVGRALEEGAPLRGALLALRLKDGKLLRHALLSTRADQARRGAGWKCFALGSRWESGVGA